MCYRQLLKDTHIRGCAVIKFCWNKANNSLVFNPLSRTHEGQATLERPKLSHYFSVVVTGDDVGLGKPDPTIYRRTCRQLGLTPDNVLVFEDAVSGVQAAREAGMRCIGVLGERTAAKPLLEAGASRVITSFISLSVDEVVRFV